MSQQWNAWDDWWASEEVASPVGFPYTGDKQASPSPVLTKKNKKTHLRKQKVRIFVSAVGDICPFVYRFAFCSVDNEKQSQSDVDNRSVNR